MSADLFHIQSLPDAPLLRRASLAAARPFLSWLLRLPACHAILQQTRLAARETPFETRALEALDIRPACPPAQMALIPRHGPVLIAANHPHGAVDGLVLAALAGGVRSDVRLLANHLLARIPELAASCFFVDPFGGPAAAARSRSGLRAAHLWLRKGGALIVFPAGEVAHDRRSDGSFADSPWRSTIGRMAIATGADVVPAFIGGTNSRWFHAAGRIHASLRTALLARELLKARGQEVAVRFGPPLSMSQLARGDADGAAATLSIRAAMEHLREAFQRTAFADAAAVRRPASATTTAARRTGGEGGGFTATREAGASARRPATAGSGVSVEAIESEITSLSAAGRLVESGVFQVFCATAPEIPAALHEIGRLREATYRAIGEGTGRQLDVDAFDQRYLHLFSWDRDRRQIVGAYRIGQTDRIIAAEGVEGLYTRTLFRYDEGLIARLSPALELGRAFVRAEYQKNYTALLLLWKGIGQFVARHPHYRVLFGTVSISARYSDVSHRLLMAFLVQNHLDRGLAALVEAVNPHAVKPAPPFASAIPRSVDEANRVVMRTEAGERGMPVLLRQYLKLNARLIGFNVDPNFGDALDALMMVDLASVDRAILNRYFGRQEADQFLARHRQAAHAA
jgi:putative hemolysin